MGTTTTTTRLFLVVLQILLFVVIIIQSIEGLNIYLNNRNQKIKTLFYKAIICRKMFSHSTTLIFYSILALHRGSIIIVSITRYKKSRAQVQQFRHILQEKIKILFGMEVDLLSFYTKFIFTLVIYMLVFHFFLIS